MFTKHNTLARKISVSLIIVVLLSTAFIPVAFASDADTIAQPQGQDKQGGVTPEELTNIISNLPTGTKGTQIVEEAITRLGDPTSLALRGTGDYVDCSYLVWWAYKQAGISIPSTSVEQAKYCYNKGYLVGESELQPGDLVFWSEKTCNCGRWHEIYHVAIYAGNNKIIESRSSKGCVVIDDIWGKNGNTWQIFMYARPYITQADNTQPGK